MPLARKLRKKKNYRRLLFCPFQPDHYDNKLQAHLTLVQACFCKGKISNKSSSLLSVICSMRSLDAHGSAQKKKMKLHEIAGNEKIKQEQFILPFEFMGILTQGILKLDLGTNVPRQPSSTRPFSKNIYIFLQLQRYKVKVVYYRHYNARDLSHKFIN